MELISQKVTHIRFGEGCVVSKTENRIGIHFSDPIGQKLFIFPDAFVQYLRMHDPKAQEYVINQYYRNQKEMEAEKQRKLHLQREEEEREAAADAARITANRKKAASKRRTSGNKK
ncbi:hypothetical protein MNQ98_04910 [Paenibacillus sp. N3/727]|uniref:hypothetical protein n=1 Tax=Paenibacillus sp. N3/727 TaxID=2925845 RepID=UPI001F530A80|nr:hypothetical protein [Paenibacillus sp. N3/727]UNK19377.1 hypothetical protein MNQ98_04910 [Paenibacillus sp. N3/727]